MLHKILGILDLITALALILSLLTSLIPSSLILILGIYLLIKGFMFTLIFDFASILDVFSAIIILISAIWSIPLLLGILITLFLGWKGILSLL